MTTDLSRPAGDRDEQAALWCVELSSGALGPEKSKAFDAWIADGDNAAAFQDAADAWRSVDAFAETPELVALRAASLERFRKQNRRRWSAVPDRRRWMGVAASIFAVAVVSATIFSLAPRTTTFETGVGERRVGALPDGSTVSMDADTQVDIRYNNRRRELVLVRGRAKFDVARDALRPFAVEADGQTVVATGTAFSVEKLSSGIQVLLYHGSVSVVDRTAASPSEAGPQEIILTAGQSLVVPSSPSGASSPQIRPFDPAQSQRWETGALSFDDEPLSTALERLNRYSRQDVVAADADVAALRVTGVFRAGDTPAFLEGVTTLYDLKATADGRRIELARR